MKHDFLGKPLEEAKAILDAEHAPYRIADQDGEHYILLTNYCSGRYTFSVEKGIITKVVMG